MRASERLSSQFSMPSSAAFHGPRTLPVVLRVLSAWGRAKPDCFRDELGLLQSSSDPGHSSWGIKAPVLPWAAAELPCTAHSRHLLKTDSYASLTSVSKTTPFFPSLAKPYPTQVILPYKNKGLPLFRDKGQTYSLLQLLPIIQNGTAAGAGSRD